jgi:photosystem II stability/assembly factor-like uncharacterized protein
MNGHYTISKEFRDIIFLLLIASLPLPLAAQGSSIPINGQLYGDPIIGTTSLGATEAVSTVYTVTSSGVYTAEGGLAGRNPDYYSKFYTPPPGRTIVKAGTKSTRTGNERSSWQPIILLDDGTIVLPSAIPPITKKLQMTSTEEWSRAVGDAIYALTTLQVYVSRDTLNTWQVDTTGLGATHVWDIALDSAQYVFAATSTGLFMQNPDSNIWHPVTSLTNTYMTTVFIDRKNRIYVSTLFGAVYTSIDGGQTWNPMSNGLNYSDVTAFGDDVYSNVYCVAGAQVFRSDSGTTSWKEIDTSITRLFLDPVTSYNSPYKYISGDSILYLGTNYGLFASSDRGTTWAESNRGIQAGTLYGFARTQSRQFAATGLGLFYNNLGDTTWTKAFPANGYAVGNSIYTDNNGTVYTLGPIININNSQSPNANWKSTDNGVTWTPDTAGLGAMAGGSIAKYFADETGVQHYAASGVPAECYKKSSGSSWTPDTGGLSKLPANYPNVVASDQHGNIYLAVTATDSFTGLLMKRAIGGGTWSYDTAGLQGAIVYSISVDQNGNLYAGTYGNGIYKRTGSTWTSLSSPGGLSGNDAFVTAVDNTGALFAGFAYSSGFNYVWQGVYYTTNDGGSWTKVGLDGLAVRGLFSYGDSMIAATYSNGMFLLSKTGSTSVQRKNISPPGSFALFQNYPNPFNPSTVISYQLPVSSFVTMKVYDLIGKEVATLVSGQQSAGPHEVLFDGARLASGVYFYRLQAGTFSDVKKFVLLK